MKLITGSESENIDNIENYLEISPNLKKSLEPLANELTKDVDNNYLKAKIIEGFPIFSV